MRLYHVSYDRISRFELRVPRNRLPDEDDTTPRICLSDSVERCINAKPSHGQSLYQAKCHGLRVALYVYEFDTNDIPSDALIAPDELVDHYHVADAKFNHEYWLLDADIPYKETRVEFVDGGFIQPDDTHPYAYALRLSFDESETEEARRLEDSITKVNATKQDDFITTDMAILSCAEKIANLIHRKEK